MESKRIALSNGTEIRALAAEYAGAAGSNHGLTSWDELWAYTLEASRRLWEELTPVPTRRNSIRVVTTYAGFEGESDLLWSLYKDGVGADEHPEGRAKRLHPTLPLWLNREARLLVYWDHQPRMPWQTAAYYGTQRRTLRPGTYLRLHENRWTSAASTFLTPELWDPFVDAKHRPVLSTRDFDVTVGVDASTKGDTSAVVAVGRKDDRLVLVRHRIWKPTAAEPLDIEATVEAEIRELHAQYRVRQVLCDPYQLHRSIATLRGAGIAIQEFPQTTANITLMGQTLLDLLRGRNLTLYADDDLRAQALNTVAVETVRGWRIAKEKSSRKIDAIVALAMACVSAAGEPVSEPIRLWGGGTDPTPVTEQEREKADQERRERSAKAVTASVAKRGWFWPGE